MKLLFAFAYILALVSMALALDIFVTTALANDINIPVEYQDIDESQDIIVVEDTSLLTFDLTNSQDIDIGFDAVINTNYPTNNGFEIHKDNVNFVPEKRIRDVIKPKSNVNYFRLNFI